MKKLLHLATITLLWASCSSPVEETADTGGASRDASGTVPPGVSTTSAGQITAGEWNDLENWEFWKSVLAQENYAEFPVNWGFHLDRRVSIRMISEQEEVLTEQPVALLGPNDELLWQTKTNNYGEAVLWPMKNVPAHQLKIRTLEQEFDNVTFHEQGVNKLLITSGKIPMDAERLDVAFVIDATGSMSDELEYLKVELVDVINRVKVDHPNTLINMASVFYRDQGDDYVVRHSPFTSNPSETINFIKEQEAQGGGDYPEAVHDALSLATGTLQWSSTAKARILFLLLDAPPHFEQPVISSIQESVRNAAKFGIRIVPITASGINKETEFLTRSYAIATNGTYVFITDDSGIGEDHIEPTIGSFQVEFLNDLLVRLMNEYLE